MTDTEFREIMSSVPSAVAVVTAMCRSGQPAGMSVISFCSVSLDPRLILVCVDKSSRTLPVLNEAGQFAVNFLGAEHQDIAGQFASKSDDKFTGIRWERGNETGQPILSDAMGYLECSIWQMVDAGDHWIVIGRVEAGALGSTESSLVYWRREFLEVGTDSDVQS